MVSARGHRPVASASRPSPGGQPKQHPPHASLIPQIIVGATVGLTWLHNASLRRVAGDLFKPNATSVQPPAALSNQAASRPIGHRQAVRGPLLSLATGDGQRPMASCTTLRPATGYLGHLPHHDRTIHTPRRVHGFPDHRQITYGRAHFPAAIRSHCSPVPEFPASANGHSDNGR